MFADQSFGWEQRNFLVFSVSSGSKWLRPVYALNPWIEDVF